MDELGYLSNSRDWYARVEGLIRQIAAGAGGGGTDTAAMESLLEDLRTLLTAVESDTTTLNTSNDQISTTMSAIETLNGQIRNLLTEVRDNTDAIEAPLASIDQIKYLTGQTKQYAALSEQHQAVTAVPAALSLTAPNDARSVIIRGVQANGLLNNNVVRLGSNPALMHFTLLPGDTASFDASPGTYLDLSEILVMGSPGDGVAVWRMS